jgi:hypothetical protein
MFRGLTVPRPTDWYSAFSISTYFAHLARKKNPTETPAAISTVATRAPPTTVPANELSWSFFVYGTCNSKTTVVLVVVPNGRLVTPPPVSWFGVDLAVVSLGVVVVNIRVVASVVCWDGAALVLCGGDGDAVSVGTPCKVEVDVSTGVAVVDVVTAGVGFVRVIVLELIGNVDVDEGCDEEATVLVLVTANVD